VWQLLPGSRKSIMVASFPEVSSGEIYEKALADMDFLMGVITGIRNIRGEMRIPPSTLVQVVIDVPDEEKQEVLKENRTHVQTLAKVEKLSLVSHAPKPQASATAVFADAQIHVLLKDLLDFEEEKRRIRKELEKLEKDLSLSSRKLSNAQFLEKAPAHIIEEVREKVKDMMGKREKLNQNLGFFDGMGS
jgi:valyl-tRNA synthetase